MSEIDWTFRLPSAPSIQLETTSALETWLSFLPPYAYVLGIKGNVERHAIGVRRFLVVGGVNHQDGDGQLQVNQIAHLPDIGRRLADLTAEELYSWLTWGQSLGRRQRRLGERLMEEFNLALCRQLVHFMQGAMPQVTLDPHGRPIDRPS